MIKKLFLNDGFILLLILANAAIIFLSGFDFSPQKNFLLLLADNVVTIIFIIELFIKLSVYGKDYFKSSWNKFDFALILLSIPALVMFALNFDNNSFYFPMIFRVMRVFKSFRFLKFIPGIDHLIMGIRRALKASVIVLLGFFVYIFIIGIFSFYLFKDSAPEFFENPLISLYSTFKIFTIEGWFDIPEQVTKNFSHLGSFFTYLYFIFVVLSGGILGLSLVNSIFVEAMVSDNNEELEKKVERLEAKIDLLIERANTK
ncbi:MAG: ion transporter [Bacteroidia bacterium]